LAEVPERFHSPNEPTLFISKQRRRHIDGYLGSFAVGDIDDQACYRRPSFHGVPEGAGVPTQIGAEYFITETAQNLGAAKARDLLGSPVEAGDAPFSVHRQDAVRNAVNHSLKTIG
jgi:hypothetical protein